MDRLSFADDGRLKLLTIVGTRPEVIRLSEVIKKCRSHFDCLLAHTGQNYDYTLCLLRRFCYAVPRAAATPFRGWLIRADAATVRPTRGARAPLLA